jgi:prepilin-type N-terminal cleavage/methylation domain-containing protein
MSRSSPSRRKRSPLSTKQRGFTLVEILVVVAIIVILMAILIPVAMGAISRARNAAIGFEISQLKTAVEQYKKDHGDYPPSMDWDPNYGANFGAQQSKWYASNAPTAYAYSSICERHFLRCYPKMTSAEKYKFYGAIAPRLDQDEALVFWLAMIANDPRQPFKNFVFNNSGVLYYAGGNDTTQLNFNDYPGSFTRFVHYDFDSRRLIDSDADGIPGYEAQYCKGTTYMYFDSRTYSFPTINDPTSGTYYAARRVAQPYSDIVAINKGQPKFMNPTTFQIVCSGQDGDYGLVPLNASFNWANTKTFGPVLKNTNEEDMDNMADFTEGRKLIDHRAP